jgi:inosine-uridine nucleoside N-ribohydrolase
VLARISSQTCIEALLQTCRQLLEKNEKMTVAVTGPASNLAIFLLAFPDLAEKTIEQFVVMGGTLDEEGNSNRSRTAEW